MLPRSVKTWQAYSDIKSPDERTFDEQLAATTESGPQNITYLLLRICVYAYEYIVQAYIYCTSRLGLHMEILLKFDELLEIPEDNYLSLKLPINVSLVCE